MSDYFTNLVIRSFSPLVSVQPMGQFRSMAQEPFERPLETFLDPPGETSSSSDDARAEPNGPTAPGNPSRDKPARLEGPIRETPIGSDQLLPTAPFVNSESNTVPPSQHISPKPVEFAALRRQSNPSLPNDSGAKPEERAGKQTSLESVIARVNLTPTETPSEPARLRASLKRERIEELSAESPGTTSFGEVLPEKNIYRSIRVTGNTDAYTHHEPIEAGISIRHQMKTAEKADSLSPQTSPAHLAQSVSADKLQMPAVAGSAPKLTTAALEERQETRTSLTTLVPKVSSQPLLPVGVKTRSNFASREAPFETAAQPASTENIINVAIGRIEIRATPSAGAKREQQSKGPKVMNLDDYMQQRSRGNG
jgi:hypothetical protein